MAAHTSPAASPRPHLQDQGNDREHEQHEADQARNCADRGARHQQGRNDQDNESDDAAQQAGRPPAPRTLAPRRFECGRAAAVTDKRLVGDLRAALFADHVDPFKPRRSIGGPGAGVVSMWDYKLLLYTA